MVRSFVKDDQAVAYLIAYVLLAFFIFGITYSILMDVSDIFPSFFSSLGALGAEYHDADTVYGFDFLNFLISFAVVFFVIGIIHFVFVMSQKPETPWP